MSGSTAKGLWQRPQRLGFAAAITGTGGIVAPFLAGFSLSTIAILVTASDRPKLTEPAILAFAGAASMLLHSMQVGFIALEHYASPEDWLAWYPEATVNKLSLNGIRQRQAVAHARIVASAKRHAITYELGLMLFLLGLFLLIWPTWPAKGHPSIWRLVGLAVVGVAFLIEVWWSVARQYNARQETKGKTKRMRRPTPWPDVSDIVVAEATPTELAAAFDPERREGAHLGYPDLSARAHEI